MLDSYRVKKLNSRPLDIKRKMLFSVFFKTLVKGVQCTSISKDVSSVQGEVRAACGASDQIMIHHSFTFQKTHRRDGEKQKSDKAALEDAAGSGDAAPGGRRWAQQQIRKQEESLKRRSSHLESTAQGPAGREGRRTEEARQREQQETELQERQREGRSASCVSRKELQRLQELNSHEKAEKGADISGAGATQEGKRSSTPS